MSILLATPEERVKLLRAGLTGREIEKLYIERNGFVTMTVPVLFNLDPPGKRRQNVVTNKQLLDIGNRFLKANSKASKLRKEFETMLLDHCGLDDMPDMGSDMLADLDCYGGGGMIQKQLDQIIAEIKKAVERE